MKIYYFFPFFFLFILISCNKDEGFGGSSSIEGYVYNVTHYDNNYSFTTDTFPAVNEDVFIEFGDDPSVGERKRTGREGYYRFDYLRKGDYTVYSLSDFADNHKEAVAKKVKVIDKSHKADPIYIHSGKAYGTAMIKGNVYATYYHNGAYRGEGPGTGMRAFIKHEGEEGYFNDMRVADGVFIFQKLLPGRYVVAVVNEDKDTRVVSLIVSDVIEIIQTGIIYEIEKEFIVDASV